MKKTLISIITLVFVISGYAQLPPEFNNYRNLKKAQPTEEVQPVETGPKTDVSPVGSTQSRETVDSKLIAKIALDGAFILSQSYQLENSDGESFGFKGNKEFGSEMSIALRVRGGYLFYDVARAPWNYNSSFAKYKDRYKPVLFPTQYSEIYDKAQYDSLHFDGKDIVTVYPDQLYGMKTNRFYNDGFSVGHQIGDIEGCMVWFAIRSGSDCIHPTPNNIL